jgi:hypothetical protein
MVLVCDHVMKSDYGCVSDCMAECGRCFAATGTYVVWWRRIIPRTEGTIQAAQAQDARCRKAGRSWL